MSVKADSFLVIHWFGTQLRWPEYATATGRGGLQHAGLVTQGGGSSREVFGTRRLGEQVTPAGPWGMPSPLHAEVERHRDDGAAAFLAKDAFQEESVEQQ